MKLFVVLALVAFSGIGVASTASVKGENKLPPAESEFPRTCEEIGAEEGKECNPMEDCKQCGYCDTFLRCDNATMTWMEEKCQVIVSEGGRVLRSNKLFWNQGSNEHGGICDFWGSLEETLRSTYRSDPACKPECKFTPDENCARRYTYEDPDFDAGVWYDPPTILECPEKTRWDQDSLTCTFCEEGRDCNANC